MNSAMSRLNEAGVGMDTPLVDSEVYIHCMDVFMILIDDNGTWDDVSMKTGGSIGEFGIGVWFRRRIAR